MGKNDRKRVDYKDILFFKTDTFISMLPADPLTPGDLPNAKSSEAISDSIASFSAPANPNGSHDLNEVGAASTSRAASAKSAASHSGASNPAAGLTSLSSASNAAPEDTAYPSLRPISPQQWPSQTSAASRAPSAHSRPQSSIGKSQTKPPPTLAEIRAPRQIHHSFYTFTPPDSTQPAPRLVAVAPNAAAALDIDIASLRATTSISMLAGTQLHPDAQPYASNYGGHQYGIYAGQLGDGRCITIGEIAGAKGDRYSIQIKGAGPTAYCRGGDGYITLRACIVEMLVTEYLAAVGVPTSRSLSVVATSRPLFRGRSKPAPPPSTTATVHAADQNHSSTLSSREPNLNSSAPSLGLSGLATAVRNPTHGTFQKRNQKQNNPETSPIPPQPTTIPIADTSAILTRFAPTWIRFGTFELFHFRDDRENLRRLADYCIRMFYHEAASEEGSQTLLTNALIPTGMVVSTGNEEGTLGIVPSPTDDLGTANTHLENHTVITTSATNAKDNASVNTLSNTTAMSSSTTTLSMQSPTMDRTPSDPQRSAPFTVLSKAVTVPLNRYAIFFRMVVKRTATLVAYWQAYGFVHGTLGTNAMSIFGITIHPGPCGFMDSYDPEWTPNRADVDEMYRFEMQPLSVQWNLSRLGRTLVDLVGEPWIAHSKPAEKRPIRTPDRGASAHHKSGGNQQQQHQRSGDVSTVNPETSGTTQPPQPIDPTTAELLAAALEANAYRTRTAPSLPSRRRLPLGFLFNATNGENIIREILKEYERYFLDAFTDIMCRRLGFLHRKDTDLERLILPLLNMMADTGVDYILFFRSLCYFKCADEGFAYMIAMDPSGRHSEQALSEEPKVVGNQQSEPSSYASVNERAGVDIQMDDPLTLLLKSLTRIHREEQEYFEAIEREKQAAILAQKQQMLQLSGDNYSLNAQQAARFGSMAKLMMTPTTQGAPTSLSSSSREELDRAALMKKSKMGSLDMFSGRLERNQHPTPRPSGLRDVSESGDTIQMPSASKLSSDNGNGLSDDYIAESASANNQQAFGNKMRSRGDALLSSLDSLGFKRRQNGQAEAQPRPIVQVQQDAQQQSLSSSASKLANGGANATFPTQQQPTLLNKDKPSKIRETYETAHRFPTINEVAASWKYWAHLYRSRLLSELSPQKRSTQGGLDVEDVFRMNRMRHINPRYALRGWVLKEALDALEAEFPPVVEDAGGAGGGKGSKRSKQHGGHNSSVSPAPGDKPDVLASGSSVSTNTSSAPEHALSNPSNPQQQLQSATPAAGASVSISVSNALQQLSTPISPQSQDIPMLMVSQSNIKSSSDGGKATTSENPSDSGSARQVNPAHLMITKAPLQSTSTASSAPGSPNAGHLTPTQPQRSRSPSLSSSHRASTSLRPSTSAGEAEAADAAVSAGAATHTLQDYDTKSSASGESKHVARILKVLIRDVWGDIAESPQGWVDEDDRNASVKWAKEPTKKLNNMMVRMFS